MFERYNMTFGPRRDGGRGAGQAPGPGAESSDLPFDRDLKRRILGNEAPACDTAATPRSTAPEPAGDRIAEQPAGTGRELQVLGSWQCIRPVWRRQQAAAQRVRGRSPEVRKATDILRTRLLQKLRAEGWTRVAVTAPSAGCGTTFMTLNLALSISAVPDLRAVLLDLNQRNPDLGRVLGGNDTRRLEDFLGGHVPLTHYLQRFADNLAVGLNSEIPANPAEILQSRSTAQALDEIESLLSPDVVLCDLPPLLDHDDAIAILPRVDCVLLVADGTKTLASQITECEELLEGRAPLLGVVLNRGRGPK